MEMIEKICRYFSDGENSAQRLGLELEHFVCDEDLKMPSYQQICEIMEEIRRKAGGEYYLEQGNICGILFEEYMVSLEPAGQVEISIAPEKKISDIRRIYENFLALWTPVLEKRGYRLLRRGVHPLVEDGTLKPDAFPLIPKKRYEYMDQYFQDSGRYGKYMMRATASTQVSIDYSSEEDAVRKYQILEKLSPLFSLLMEELSGSTLSEEFQPHCLRLQIWNGTDGDRCGYVPGSLDASFGYRKYAEYVYNRPMILVKRNGEAIKTGKETAAGYQGEKDREFVEHILSMFFPNIRLKKYLEIRMADSAPQEKVLGYLALIRGLMYGKGNLETLRGMLAQVTETKEIYEAEAAIMRQGYAASVYGKTAAEWLLALYDMAYDALDTEDRGYLQGIFTAPLLQADCCRRIQKDLREHRQSALAAREYMLGSTAKYHNRAVKSLYIPKFFREDDAARLGDLIAQLYGIFDKVINEYRKSAAYRKLFGFDRRIEELILREKSYGCSLPIARIDVFYDEETKRMTFCEFNTDGTSAMNEDRELNNAFRKTELYRELSGRFQMEPYELFSSWVEAFLQIYADFAEHSGRARTPKVAIVDFMENATVNEFQIFAEHFRKRGICCEVCEIRDLRWNGARLLMPSGMEIDAIYRRAVTSDIEAHFDEVRDMIEAVKANAVCLIGDFQTQIVHNKILFKILYLPETQRLLNGQEKRFVRDHVPYTVSLDSALREKDPRLIEEVMEDKDNWIIKPEDSYGSHGVHAGVECGPQEWRDIVLQNIDRHYILQRFCVPYRLRNVDFSAGDAGEGKWLDASNLTGIFVYNGQLKGFYSRVSYDKMISTQYNEMALPTVLLRPGRE